ncbi:MAG: hypothetical protein JSR87_06315 [Proteobacteria bacterium]|nr:hypothetical protein [Pseudomonadota bacterium]MBS0574765.1 hypothetical protein [Pseudomonadota bacterium]
MRRILGTGRVETSLRNGDFSIARTDLQQKYPRLGKKVSYFFVSSASGKVALVEAKKNWLISFESDDELANYIFSVLSSDPHPGKIEEEAQSKNGLLSKVFEVAWVEISEVKSKDEAVLCYKKLRKTYPDALRELRLLLICSLLGNLILLNSKAVWVCRISSFGRLDEIGVHGKAKFADVGDFVVRIWKKHNFPIERLEMELVEDVAQICKNAATSSSLDDYRVL